MLPFLPEIRCVSVYLKMSVRTVQSRDWQTLSGKEQRVSEALGTTGTLSKNLKSRQSPKSKFHLRPTSL